MSNLTKVLSVLALLLLGACTPTQEEVIPKDQEVVFKDPLGSPVNSPVIIPYVWNNPITISTYTQDETETVYTSYLKITGLKDKTVEDKINTAIKAKFTDFTNYGDLKNLPPFRGIKQKVKDGATVQNINVYVNSAYNANGVFSVSFTLFLSILNPDQSVVYMNLSDGMTFELVHGEILSLADVFTNDADISKLVNDSLSKTFTKLDHSDPFGYAYGNLTLIKPFMGIRADQPFFVSEAGLHVLFDYRTPDFETNFSTSVLTVPYYAFLNYIGLTQRFSASTDIFEKPILDRQFLMLGDAQDEHLLEKIPIGSRDFTLRLSYPKNLDQVLIDRLLVNKTKIKNELTAFISSHTVDYLSGSLFANQIGTYTCLFTNYEAYGQAESLYGSDFECYDKHLVLLEIADYFKPGYDYESALRNAIQKEVNEGYLNTDISMDELFENMTMRIETTGFYIGSKAYSPSAQATQYLGLAPLFSEFGVENLTVFD